MKFAATIGAYALPHFVELNIVSLRRVFGPDLPILISDDKSPESGAMEALAEKHDCAYYRSPDRRYHFAGDMQAVLNAAMFARQEKADIGFKISQRFIIANPIIRERVEEAFSNPDVIVASPGQLPKNQICGSKGFAYYRLLTDAVFMRTDAVDPAWIKDRYEVHWKTSKNAHDCIVEIFFAHLVFDADWMGKWAKLDALTFHDPHRPKWFHRRYMSTSAEIRRFAQSVGLDGHYQVGEWKQLDLKYQPRPRA